MDSNNVVHYNFKSNGKAESDSSSPPTSAVKAFITRKQGNVHVVTNLSDLSEQDLLWALINGAAASLKNREKVMDEKVELVKEYITQ